MGLTDRLKEAVIASGKNHSQLARESGVARASIIRFLRRETSLNLDKAEKLASCVGLIAVRKEQPVRERKYEQARPEGLSIFQIAKEVDKELGNDQ